MAKHGSSPADQLVPSLPRPRKIIPSGVTQCFVWGRGENHPEMQTSRKKLQVLNLGREVGSLSAPTVCH